MLCLLQGKKKHISVKKLGCLWAHLVGLNVIIVS
jgi:hypothetical protein